MSINKPEPYVCELHNTDKISLDCSTQTPPLDTCVLKSMADAYFPELFSKTDDKTPDSSRFISVEQSNKTEINLCDDKEKSADQQNNRQVLIASDFTRALIEMIDPLNQSEKEKASIPRQENIYSHNKEDCIDLTKLSTIGVPVPDLTNHLSFDVNAVRKDFPMLLEKVNNKNLIWFDNAATTQKPKCVIDRLKYFYEHENSNVHRAAHTLAARATDIYEEARAKVATFLNAARISEIVFVRSTTEAINLVAQTYGLLNLSKDDEVIISMLEHHSNIVPWQLVCAKTGAILKTIPIDENGQIILSEYERLLSKKTKIVSIIHVSNVLGTITPLKQMIDMAHQYGAKVLVDGAQAVAHIKVDVQSLDCDFYAFSGHKIFAPMGIGVLYGKGEILNEMQPYQAGGNMISNVTIHKSTYQSPPARFEAGTSSIADAVGLGASIDYITNLGMQSILKYEHQLLEYGIKSLQQIPNVILLGMTNHKTSILPFILKGFTSENVGKALDKEGIAVRTGHHCAQPLLRRYGLESTIRLSLAFYNTKEEINSLVAVIRTLANGYSC